MENMPFPVFILLSVPENLLLFYLGLGLVGLSRPPFHQLLAVALLNALFSFVVRNLPLPPGIFFFIQVPFIIISLIFICKLSAIYSTVISFLGLIFLALTETLIELFVTNLTGISYQTFTNNPELHLIFAVPDFLGCLLIIFILNHWRIVLFDIQAVMDRDKGQAS